MSKQYKLIVVFVMSSVKHYKYSVRTLYIDDNVTIRRTVHNNALYIYIYIKDYLVVGLKVTIRE
jgi:hypothetical protein